MEETIIMDGQPMPMDYDPYFDDFENFKRHMFDDDTDDVLRSHGRGRTDLRAHLDDLARRHPEFADHLRSPPGWVSDFHTSSSGGGGGSSSGGHFAGSFGGSGGSEGGYFKEGERSNPNNSNKDQQPQQAQEQTQPAAENQQQGPPQQPAAENIPERKASASYSSAAPLPPFNRDRLSHGLRNTDPEIGLKGQAAVKEDRNQRSMSAPPDGRSQLNSDKPQRFVSKIEINPVNPATGETAGPSNSDSSAGKPPMAPPKQPPQQQPNQGTPPQHKTSTVRHIPIFVEGRDEPVLPKNVDEDFAAPPSRPAPQQQQQQPFHPQQQQFHPHQPQPPQRKPSNHQQFQQQPNRQQQPPAPPPPPQQQQQQPQPQESKENVNQQQQSAQPQAEKKQKFNNDPMYQIQAVQSEVDELRKRIEIFKGCTRADKEYIYLDEMLTRNLIKLDIIETDGKENVRAARKETIKSIQQCINLLESKVPATPVSQTPSNNVIEDSGSKMDVDQSTTNCLSNESGCNSTVPSGNADCKQKMETDQLPDVQSDKNTSENKMIVEESQLQNVSDGKPTQQNTDNSQKDKNSHATLNPNEIKC